jgi:hypothetical protein
LLPYCCCRCGVAVATLVLERATMLLLQRCYCNALRHCCCCALRRCCCGALVALWRCG